jgi:hypothetical protein
MLACRAAPSCQASSEVRLRAKHGCTGQRVMQLPDDGNNLFLTHEFPSAEQAAGFAHDPALQAGMEQPGVEGAARIEIFTDV